MTTKLIAAAIAISLGLIFSISINHEHLLNYFTSDSVNVNQNKTVREVLTGQRLVVVSLTPHQNKDSVQFEAVLKDCYKIISYEKDSVIILKDWTVCPNDKCPEAKLYYPNKADYRDLDKMINNQYKLGTNKK